MFMSKLLETNAAPAAGRRVRARYLPVLVIFALVWFASLSDYTASYRQSLRSQLQRNLQSSFKLLRGQSWDATLHNTLAPECPAGKTVTKKYMRGRSHAIALASFPRSGNSYTRSLIERASGYQTSSLYCDARLRPAFHAECDGWNNPWIIKNHWPAGKNVSSIGAWQKFDKALILVRNPLDVAWSLYNLEKTSSHNKRLKNFKFGKKHHKHLKSYADILAKHTAYWLGEANIRTHVIRYEDLRTNTFVETMSMLNFILPQGDLPSLEKVACAVEEDPEKDAYRSHKYPPFYSWNKFEPDTRDYFLGLVSELWCKFGYDSLLRETLGVEGVDCKRLSQAVAQKPDLNRILQEALAE